MPAELVKSLKTIFIQIIHKSNNLNLKDTPLPQSKKRCPLVNDRIPPINCNWRCWSKAVAFGGKRRGNFPSCPETEKGSCRDLMNSYYEHPACPKNSQKTSQKWNTPPITVSSLWRWRVPARSNNYLRFRHWLFWIRRSCFLKEAILERRLVDIDVFISQLHFNAATSDEDCMFWMFIVNGPRTLLLLLLYWLLTWVVIFFLYLFEYKMS